MQVNGDQVIFDHLLSASRPLGCNAPISKPLPGGQAEKLQRVHVSAQAAAGRLRSSISNSDLIE
jgi:hypothetical protein